MNRVTRLQVKEILAESPELRVLDAACGHHAGWPEADVLSDWGPYGKNYDKPFVKADIRDLPFDDHEFDFVIASHIVEHIPETDKVLGELMRVARAGYIETPTPFLDNLVAGNDRKHKWWVTFDDMSQRLIFRPRKKVVPTRIKIPGWTKLREQFPESCITSVMWSGVINYQHLEE